MKKLKVLVALLLVASLLSGCSLLNTVLSQSEKEYTQGDVSVMLPANCLNYSDTAVADDMTFMFANDNIGFLGIEENKADLFALYGEMDLHSYAQLIVQLYELDTEPVQKDGFWTVTYTNSTDSDVYTYVSVFHETSTSYWNMQAYSLESKYEEYAEDLWRYATTVQIADDGVAPEVSEATEETTETPTQAVTGETQASVEDTQVQLPVLNLPKDFLNYTDTALGAGYDLVYGNDDIGIIGIADNKEQISAYFGDTDLEGYANLIVALYELDTEAQQKDGIWTCTYTAESEGSSFTYVSAFCETETEFWNIQGYCLTEVYDQYADDIWQYITDVDFPEEN